MSTTQEILEIIIQGTDKASGEFGKASTALEKLGGIGKGILTVGMTAAAAGVAALGAGLGIAVSEAMEAQAGLAQLDAVLESTGGAAGVTRDMALELADSLSAVTRFSDDSVLAAENLLLTFTNIGEDVFPRATETLLDMATAMGTDAKSGAIQLGKALNDPVAGITALTRVGVTFTDEQKKMIEQMVAMGDVAGAQTIILDELQKEFGGSAEAAGQTFAGQLDILKNSLLNVAEGVGMALLPLLQDLTSFVTENVLPWVQGVGEEFSRLLGIFQEVGWKDFFVTFEDGSSWVGSFFETLGFGEETAYRIGDAINNLVQWLGTNLPIAFQAVSDFWTTTLYPALQEIGVWLGENIPLAIDFLRTKFDEFLLSIQPVVDNFITLVTTVSEDFPLMQEAAATFMEWFNTEFYPVIDTTIANLKGIYNSLVTSTSTGLADMNTFWQAHGEQVIQIVTVAFQTITVVIGGAITIISGLVNAWLLLWQGDTDAALDALQNSFNSFFESVLSLVGTSGAEFEQTWSGTLELIRLAWDTWSADIMLNVSTWILNFLNTWETNWNNLQLIVETVFGNITTTFNTFKQTINSIIERVQALINKILAIPGIPGQGTTDNTDTGNNGGFQVAGGLTPPETPTVNQPVVDLLGAMIAACDAMYGDTAMDGRVRVPGSFGGDRSGNPKGGTYHLHINTTAGVENILDDFAMLEALAAG